MATPERFLQNVTSRVGFKLPLIDLSISVEPTDVGVILRDLLDAARGWQKVDATISDVSKINPRGSEPAQAECGTHAMAFLVAGSQV